MSNVTVYTCILNGYDNLRAPRVINPNVRYVCYSDEPLPKVEPWEILPAYQPYHGDLARNVRVHKILCHLFTDTEYSIWMDANFELLADPIKLIDALKKSSIALFEHPYRNCIYKEADFCINTGKDSTETITQQVAAYRAAAYPSDNGLYACGLIVRRNTEEIKALNERWWQEVVCRTARDQISFPFAAQGVQIETLKGPVLGSNGIAKYHIHGIFREHEHNEEFEARAEALIWRRDHLKALCPRRKSESKGRIALFRPIVDTDKAVARIRSVLETGWLGQGPLVEEFETRFGQLVGASNTVATNSCTTALHLAVKSLGLPVGSRVLTTPISFVSTAMVCLYEELEVVFSDVDRDGNLSPLALPAAIEKYKPKAIIVVHLGGFPADLEQICKIADSYHIPVIEDCAHAVGSLYRGLPLGASPRICLWSFHAVKQLALADGGAITTRDHELAARLRRLRWMGIDLSTAERTKGQYKWEYDIDEIGMKGHLNDYTAALGLAQLEKLPAENRIRRQIAERYQNELTGPGRIVGRIYDGIRESSCHFVPIFFADRNTIIERLKSVGIDFGMHYKPIYRFKPFATKDWSAECPMAEDYAKHELTLPMHAALTSSDVDRIIDTVNG